MECMLSAKPDAQAATRFFRKVLQASHTTLPRVITVDKHAAYPKAFDELQQEGYLPATEPLRQVKYLNNVVEQEHRFINRLVRPGLGFGSFHTAWRTLRGHAVMHMIRKGQVRWLGATSSPKASLLPGCSGSLPKPAQ